jgi:steroid delta-isomerase-like uncharacterized protein
MNANTERARHWFDEVWNRGNADAIDDMMAPDSVAHGMADPDGQPPQGPDGFRPLLLAIRAAFPDIHITVDDAIGEDDTVAVRCTARGTHQGEWMGVEATGRPVEITGMTFTVWKEGKIVEAWNCFDFAGLYEQISDY